MMECPALDWKQRRIREGDKETNFVCILGRLFWRRAAEVQGRSTKHLKIIFKCFRMENRSGNEREENGPICRRTPSITKLISERTNHVPECDGELSIGLVVLHRTHVVQDVAAGLVANVSVVSQEGSCLLLAVQSTTIESLIEKNRQQLNYWLKTIDRNHNFENNRQRSNIWPSIFYAS